MSLLELQSVNRHFGGLKAVHNVSLTIEEGQITAIIGPNGAGKTTLFNCITGTLPLTSGTIRFRGGLISGLKPYQIAYKGIFRTFQNLKLAGHMTALENVMIGRHTKSGAGFLAALLHLPKTWREEKEIREKAYSFLELLEIEDIAHNEVANLPFGKQRAVEFARALAGEPDLLLLDEPASGLNMHETEELAELICRIKARGVTIVLVEHDMSLVMDISDSISVLNFGELIVTGTPGEVQKNEDVIKIYLGGNDA